MMRKNLVLAAGYIAVALLIAACESSPLPLGSRMESANIAPATIADWIIQGRNDFLLIDLRSYGDFKKAHIRGAIHPGREKLQKKEVVKSLPAYKKLVFYGRDESPGADLIRPVFAQGHHVLIMTDGYQGWTQSILTAPRQITSPEDTRRAAVVKYFKGESALGTPQPLKNISAEKYTRQPSLKFDKGKKDVEGQGC